LLAIIFAIILPLTIAKVSKWKLRPQVDSFSLASLSQSRRVSKASSTCTILDDGGWFLFMQFPSWDSVHLVKAYHSSGRKATQLKITIFQEKQFNYYIFLI
jgi:hypothetical protein